MLAEAANAVTDTSSIIAALKRAAAATGSDFNYLLATAKRESGLKTDVKSSTSSATGLFQFVDQTWLGLIKNHGAKYGLGSMAAAISQDGEGHYRTANPADRQAILALRTDPQVSSLMAGEFTKSCQNRLEGALGRDVCSGELYAAHFLGAGAACKLIKLKEADPAASAANAFPAAAAANKTVFYNPDGSAKSVSEVYNWAMKHAGGRAASKAVPVTASSASMPAHAAVDTGFCPSVTPTMNFTRWQPTRGLFSTDMLAQLPSTPLLFTSGIFDVLSGSQSDYAKKN